MKAERRATCFRRGSSDMGGKEGRVTTGASVPEPRVAGDRAGGRVAAATAAGENLTMVGGTEEEGEKQQAN